MRFEPILENIEEKPDLVTSVSQETDWASAGWAGKTVCRPVGPASVAVFFPHIPYVHVT